MHLLPNILFVTLLGSAVFWFSKNVGKIRRNILLGRDIDRTDNAPKRRANMFRVAFGQSKMQARPIAGILHFIIYASFLIINIEVLEIVIDGIFERIVFLLLFFQVPMMYLFPFLKYWQLPQLLP